MRNFSLLRFVGAIAVAAVLATVGVIPLAAPPAAQAHSVATYVRILHAVPDAGAVNVYVDGVKAAANLAYAKQTGFLEMDAGARHLQVFPVGTTYRATGGAIDITVAFHSDAFYTVVVAGRAGAMKPLVLIDEALNRNNPSLSKAMVRFVHVSPGTPAVDVEISGQGIVFTEVGYLHMFVKPVYVPLAEGTYTLTARQCATKVTLWCTQPLRFQAGHVYSVYALGLVKGTGEQALRVIVTDDTPLPLRHR